jgi:hypothetical protein
VPTATQAPVPSWWENCGSLPEWGTKHTDADASASALPRPRPHPRCGQAPTGCHHQEVRVHGAHMSGLGRGQPRHGSGVGRRRGTTGQLVARATPIASFLGLQLKASRGLARELAHCQAKARARTAPPRPQDVPMPPASGRWVCTRGAPMARAQGPRARLLLAHQPPPPMPRGGESDPEKWTDMVPLVGPNAPRAPARREACWLPSQSHFSTRQGAVAGAASGGARGLARPTNAKGGRAT